MSLTQNAIAYAQFRLKGGWRNIIFTSVVYAVLVCGAITLTVSLASTDSSRAAVLNGWVGIMLVIQSAVLVFFGGTRITAAIQNDAKQRMFESHRVMSMSSFEAVLGYLIGAPCQAICLAGMNLIIGSALCLKTNIGVDAFLLANASLLLTAAFLYVIVAMVAFIGRGAVAVLYIGMAIGSLNFLAAMLFPAILLLVTPIQRGSALTINAGGFSLTQYQAIGLLMQVAIGTICYVGAMRRYRWGDELPALGPWLGLCLMILFVAATVIGATHYDELAPRTFLASGGSDRGMQFIASAAAMMILAFAPISGAARMESRRRRRLAAGAEDDRRFNISVEAVAIGAAAVIMGLLLCDPVPSRMDDQTNAITVTYASIYTAVNVSAFLVATSYVWRIMLRATNRVMVVVFIWLIVSWLAPFLLNVVLTYDQPTHYLHAVAGGSPIGSLVLTWANERASPVPGLIYQCALTLALALAFYSTGRAPAADQPPAVAIA